MQIIKTLPDLPLFGMWCRNPSSGQWSPARMAQIVAANQNRANKGMPPLEVGNPTPGSMVWTGTEYAVYRP
jgi:hypothetical protein